MTISPQELRALLQQQRDTAQKLLQVLAQEHEVISGKDLHGLETILAAKEQYIAQLEASSQEYLAAARQHSTSPKSGMIALLKQRDPQGTLGQVLRL